MTQLPDDPLEARIHRLEVVLQWIKFKAGLHYLGGAFEPEHMRDIANLAADALGGRKPDLPDFTEAMATAREQGAALAALFRDLEDEEGHDY